jgi:hypothetical protein
LRDLQTIAKAVYFLMMVSKSLNSVSCEVGLGT